MSTLEKIRAEIEQMETLITKFEALQIIDKYTSEECDRDCEHCAYLECPKEPCEEAVSRQAVLDCATLITSIPTEDWDIGDWVCLFRDRVSQLPSVQPKAKTGHWIEDKTTYAGTGMGNYKCSVCDRINGSWIKDMPSVYPNFCWWCGAEMKGEQE